MKSLALSLMIWGIAVLWTRAYIGSDVDINYLVFDVCVLFIGAILYLAESIKEKK